MKITTDTLASIFGTVAGLAQIAGQTGIINQQLATSISSVAVILLGIVTNKPLPVGDTSK
jgi:hypothetical protein